MTNEPHAATEARQDEKSSRWVEQLRAGHPRHDQTVARLHDVLLRVAFHELSRRRAQLGSIAGPELEDLGHQAADDALVNIIKRLDDFRGLSRFTTWAYKFAVFEVSSKVARHAWRHQAPSADELTWERLPDRLSPRPGERLEQREQLEALSTAIAALTERQREVFVAVALNEVSIDVLALELGSNRNAIYKNLFDRPAQPARQPRARRPSGHRKGRDHPMRGDLPRLDALLRSQDGDAGCTAGEGILDAYVELELAGSDPAAVFPGTVIHLRSCPGCRADHDGLLEAAREFGDFGPE